MKRILQYRFGCYILSPLMIAFLSVYLMTPQTGHSADNEAKIEPITHKTYTETISGSDVKFDMVPIPGGVFKMGSPSDEKGRSADEGPEHLVKIRPFWMGKTEVTWDEYDLYWKKSQVDKECDQSANEKAADAVSKPTKPYADETFGHGREGQPVLCITWHAAMKYCEWLSAKTGKLYRLPTEAEWEYACRAGTTTTYFFGNDPNMLGDYAWIGKNSEDVAHPVAKKKPSPWGLYDIYGNVSEWCIDQYNKDFYATCAKEKLSLGPVLLPGPDRFPHVARGGSWADTPDKVRSASRRFSDKTWIKRDPQSPQSIWWLTDADIVGFRVICPLEEQANLRGYQSKITKESD